MPQTFNLKLGLVLQDHPEGMAFARLGEVPAFVYVFVLFLRWPNYIPNDFHTKPRFHISSGELVDHHQFPAFPWGNTESRLGVKRYPGSKFGYRSQIGEKKPNPGVQDNFRQTWWSYST